MSNTQANPPKVPLRGTTRKASRKNPDAATAANAPATARDPAPTERPPTASGIGAYRRRQASVAVILDRTFGRMAKCNPELWERRAYLMLIGTVYERLAAGPEDIPTDELIALAKALAENRRIEARSRDGKSESASGTAGGSGELPEEFDDIVRQIYGTNLHLSDEIEAKGQTSKRPKGEMQKDAIGQTGTNGDLVIERRDD